MGRAVAARHIFLVVNRETRRHLVGAAPLVALALVLSSCGDDGSDDGSVGGRDGGADPAPATDGPVDLDVVAQDIHFDRDDYATRPGTVRVRYTNEGSIRHTLVVEDVDGFSLDVTGHGDVERGTLELEPGRYVLYCDVAGHRAAGMEARLEVA
ncbi:MAG: hypothetical protein AB7L84_00095 [Acidimicrobiia bacterium]